VHTLSFLLAKGARVCTDASTVRSVHRQYKHKGSKHTNANNRDRLLCFSFAGRPRRQGFPAGTAATVQQQPGSCNYDNSPRKDGGRGSQVLRHPASASVRSSGLGTERRLLSRTTTNISRSFLCQSGERSSSSGSGWPREASLTLKAQARRRPQDPLLDPG
jgi:hypothetical protein